MLSKSIKTHLILQFLILKKSYFTDSLLLKNFYVSERFLWQQKYNKIIHKRLDCLMRYNYTTNNNKVMEQEELTSFCQFITIFLSFVHNMKRTCCTKMFFRFYAVIAKYVNFHSKVWCLAIIFFEGPKYQISTFCMSADGLHNTGLSFLKK
jgi:hypothetical protein